MSSTHHYLIPAIALSGCFVAAGCWLGWQLLRQNGRILLRLEELEKRLNELKFGEADEPDGLPLGAEAPDFELPDLPGDSKKLKHFRGQPVLLIFFNPACVFCRELAPRLAALGQKSGATSQEPGVDQSLASAATKARPLPLVISTGDADKNREFFSEQKITCPVLLQKEMEVAAAYQTNGTPTGYLISAEGKIAGRLAVGADALLALATGKAANQVNARPHPSPLSQGEGDTPERTTRFGNRSLARNKIKRDGLKAGTPAPSFRLPRLDGGELSLEELRGGRVLLVFSDPHCGPCNALASRLEKFHREHPRMGLVVISRGEPKENRAKAKEHGFTFPVVLQQQWEISRLYAMFATPIAYSITEAGLIAHDVAVGVEPILALLAQMERTDLVIGYG